MPSSETHSAAEPTARFDWPRIESALDGLAALAERAADESAFAEALLSRIVGATPATSAGLWLVDRDECRLVAASEANFESRFKRGDETAPHAEVISAAASERGIRLVLPDTSAADGSTVNPTDAMLALVPLTGEDITPRVLELLAPPAADAEQRARWHEVLRSFGEVADGYYRRQELSRLRQSTTQAARLDHFAREVHASINPRRVAMAVANEGRLVLGCDRLTVADGTSGRVLAVSGLDSFSVRSDVVSRLKRLARAVASGPGRFSARSSDGFAARTGDDVLSTAWERYRQVSPTEELAAVAVPSPEKSKRPVAVLIAERFGIEDRAATSISPERLDVLVPHTSLAFSNCREAGNGPAVRFVRTLSRALSLGRLPATLLAVACIVALAGAMIFIKVDHTVRSRGELTPTLSRNIFAPRDAIIREVAVQYGSDVAQGEVLVQLDSPELELERQRISGELQSSLERLASVRALRAAGTSGSERAVEAGRLAAEEAELVEKITGLREQSAILESELEGLRVTGPIAGTVLTWDLDDLRPGRPVARGQRLMTVASPQSEWELELHVPDDRVGDILRAASREQEPLSIRYLLATEPQTTYDAVLRDIALSSEPYEDEPSAVLMTAALVGAERPPLRPGATVVARIDCGREPLWYVWFGDLIDTIRTRLLF